VIYNIGSGTNPTSGKSLKTHLCSVVVKYVTTMKLSANQIGETNVTFSIETDFTKAIRQQVSNFRSGSTYKNLHVVWY
jgi:hypothetical protein